MLAVDTVCIQWRSHIWACMGKCTCNRLRGFYTIQITKEGVVARGDTMSRPVNMSINSSKLPPDPPKYVCT